MLDSILSNEHFYLIQILSGGIKQYNSWLIPSWFSLCKMKTVEENSLEDRLRKES